MTTVTVAARRWAGGWELILGEDDATQVRTLDRATQQIRDYLDTLEPDVDHSGVKVDIVPELGPLTDEVRQAREATHAAAQAQAEAARRAREVVRELRAEKLSFTDVAAILGVSRGRVSQLEKESSGA